MALQVRTYAGPSAIEGIGLFADEPIQAGTVVWRYDPNIDHQYTKDFVEKQIDSIKDFIIRYAYFDERLDKYIMCGDNARFMNHSENPNVVGDYPTDERIEGIDVAARDIQVGEELVCDYRTFDSDTERKMALEQRTLV